MRVLELSRVIMCAWVSLNLSREFKIYRSYGSSRCIVKDRENNPYHVVSDFWVAHGVFLWINLLISWLVDLLEVLLLPRLVCWCCSGLEDLLVLFVLGGAKVSVRSKPYLWWLGNFFGDWRADFCTKGRRSDRKGKETNWLNQIRILWRADWNGSV